MFAANICPLLAALLISAGINETFCHDAKLFPSPAANINQICENIFFEARPFPDNREYFIGCVRGQGFVLQCYQNEIFDENLLRCVYSGDTTVGIGTTSQPGFDGVCDGLLFNFIQHPSDCGKAIFCYEESPIVRECPQGQIFDPRLERLVLKA